MFSYPLPHLQHWGELLPKDEGIPKEFCEIGLMIYFLSSLVLRDYVEIVQVSGSFVLTFLRRILTKLSIIF